MSSALTIAVASPRWTYQRSRSLWKVMTISASLIGAAISSRSPDRTSGRFSRPLEPSLSRIAVSNRTLRFSRGDVMRSLLGGWSPAVISVFVAVEILACPRVASPQAAGGGAGPGNGRVAGTPVRAVVESSSSGEVALDRRAMKRLESAQTLLFDGRYADALAAFDAVLESGDARATEMLTSWALHGAAASEALAGHLSRARTLYDEMLRGS